MPDHSEPSEPFTTAQVIGCVIIVALALATLVICCGPWRK